MKKLFSKTGTITLLKKIFADSALFTVTSNNAADKHRETQLQLQRKLQEKKLLEEQRRKMNAVRDDNEQQLRTGSSLERKTPITPKGSARSSVSLDRKTPKISSTPSPLPLQSPRKFQNERTLNQSVEHVQPLAMTKQRFALPGQVSQQHETVKSNTESVCQSKKANESCVEIKQTHDEIDPKENKNKLNKSSEDKVFIFPEPNKENLDGSKTPEHCDMDTDEIPSHVRRIDFGEIHVASISEETKQMKEHVCENDSKMPEEREKLKVEATHKTMNKADVVTTEDMNSRVKASKEIGILSQSAGQLTLKTLLERKETSGNNLNKSLGFVSNRGTNLFSSQNNNSSRSAFVPFSQSRKEIIPQSSSIAANISSSSVSYQQTVYNNSIDSISKSATITISPLVSINQGATNIVDPMLRPPDNIIHIQPGTYHDETNLTDGKYPKISSVVVSFTAGTKPNGAESINTTVTHKNPMLCSLATQDMKHLSSQISPGTSKQIKTPRFTPIKPKSSPQKSSTYTKSTSDGPAYDKRPVSAILKEKREREKAEALAKFQASIRLPAIPTLSGLQLQQVAPTLNPGQVGNIAPLTGEIIKFQGPCNVPTKDVVIFVNNSGTVSVPNVVTPVTSRSIDSQIVQVSATDNFVASNINEQNPQKDVNPRKNQMIAADTDDDSKDLSERDTPNIEDIIFSPDNDSGRSEILERKAEGEFSETSESEQNISDIEHVSMEIDRNERQEWIESDNNMESDKATEERLDSLETQTPIKIAKLNVESPFRPESACSLGRETPIKIMKSGDMSLVRPESACSHGRDTPSGGRKRKSSGNVQQRNFKRLNSTGEVEDNENETVHDLFANILDHQKAEIRTYNQRRTHSCTLELDKDRKHGGLSHNKSFTLDSVRVSLQSPDITSLEREALIDAFPHTACSIKPTKSQNSAQRSSIGISSESFRNALKLKKQQGYLNERVNTFLMRKNTGISMATVNEQNDALKVEKMNVDVDQPRANADSKTGFDEKRMKSDKCREIGLESDIPSDVADFINETIEKRESANNSVLSEPGFINDEQISPKNVEDMNLGNENGSYVADNGKLLGGNVVSPEQPVANADQLNTMKRSPEQSKTIDNFTIPKVPPFNFRLRESNIRLPTPELYSHQQRCSSLPTFTSPVRSPVSPLGRQPVYQRSISISPGVAQSPDKEISKISQGALQRVEIRDNHPISVSVHRSINTADDNLFVRPNSLPIRISHHEEKGPITTPYLASLQHNLQKPRETPIDQRGVRQKDSPIEKQSNIASPVGRGQLSREPSADRMSFTPFSDRGYHSIGNSPILNSTPVSLTEGDLLNMGQSARQCISAGVMLSPQGQFPSTSISPQINFGQILGSVGGSVVSINQLNSSATSAFIPIQGSSNEIRYVTPIRPMATVAYEKTDNVAYSPNDNGPEIENTYLSDAGKGQDPPPYEFAVRQLRKSNSGLEVVENANPFENLVLDKENNGKDHTLANMGQVIDERNVNQVGPCSARLAQLSRQSKQFRGGKPQESYPNIMSALNEPAKDIGQLFMTEQSKPSIDFHEANNNKKNPKKELFHPPNFPVNNLISANEEMIMDSRSAKEVGPQSEISIADPIYGETREQIISSLNNAHSNILAHEFDANIVCSKNKVLDPSFNVIPTENVLQTNLAAEKFMQPIPNKLLSSVHARRSSFPTSVCTLGQNALQEDPYQEMSRNELTNAEVDPLGNTLEDLREILSDKSVVVDNGFCGESDISTGEEGFGQLLFGDE